MSTRTASLNNLLVGLAVVFISNSSHAYRLWEPEDGVPIRQGH